MVVWGSSGPSDRYSAIPSMNHSGKDSAPADPAATDEAFVLVMSY
jgi:hypothetical protein